MAKRKRCWNVTPALVSEGSLFASGAGQWIRRGPFLAVCNFFDERLRALARNCGAEEHSYPAMIRAEVLRELDYFSSFPELATFATHSNGGRDHVLSPAVCYHTYQLLRNQELSRHPYYVTAAGNCFRFEGKALTETPERLWNFTMREVIFFGRAVEVVRIRKRLMGAVPKLAATAGLETTLEEATDPFFLGGARGKVLIQRLKKLKYELKARISRDRALALASFNNHEDFFAKRMNIRLAGGGLAHSGCAAFGIERWAYAFFCQNGPDSARWPERINRYVRRHAAG
jgi:seryl-tRNA synthetase